MAAEEAAAPAAGRVSEGDTVSEAPKAVAGAPRPAIAAQGVQAGEWDDNANYQEFQKWLAGAGSSHHRVDLSQRRFLVVRDSDGKAVPRCKVAVRDEAQHEAVFVTGPSGRAILFPRAEGLAGQKLTATANCLGSAVSAPIALAEADGVVDLKLPKARQLPSRRVLDVAFVLDTTGSMSEEISAVKATIRGVASLLSREQWDLRIGMVAFKDRGDSYVTQVYPMTADINRFDRDTANISASGGGDTPESVNEGLHVALSGLQWNPDAIGRFAFLVGDAPPHLDYRQDFDYAQEMKNASHRGIQVFTVAASGMDHLGQVVFRQVAQYSGASSLFVLRGGAGPQSTGGGDPGSSCGGTHRNYTSGQLDQLILAKIKQQMKMVDADPLRIAGLGRDENAKPCAERVLIVAE